MLRLFVKRGDRVVRYRGPRRDQTRSAITHVAAKLQSAAKRLSPTAYLILGAKLEERKLIVKFGDRYRRYRQQVPAFIPRRLPRLRYLLYPPDQ
jgi:hypothetical protein